MTDDKLDPRIADLARSYNEPPPVPRERLWQGIEATRQKQREEAEQRRAADGPKIYRLVWRTAAIAAVLVLGIAIGRWSLPIGDDIVVAQRDAPAGEFRSDQAVTPVTDTTADPDSRARDQRDAAADRQKIFRYAAAPILGQAETLLTAYRTDAATDIIDAADVNYTQRARKLLTDTRLLLDSPAAEDPALGSLLSDLELVLAQIVHIADNQKAEDKEWIAEGIENRSLLPRLRNQMTVRTAANRL